MIDFNALLNAAFEAAIEAKVAPLRKQIEALNTDGLKGIVRTDAMGELALVADIKKLVDARVEHGIDAHKEEYDHDEFVEKRNIESEIEDQLSTTFQSKVEAAIDGLRVTLNT